jgi:transketolase
MLGAQHNPFATGGDPNTPGFKVQNLNLANGLNLEKLDDRRSLVKHFDQVRHQLNGAAEAQVMDRFSQEAYEFVTGANARSAFDLAKEDPKLRDQYGRTSWGQSTLLARRLVEAGSTFGWSTFADDAIGIDRFGASAPGNVALARLGISVDNVVARAKDLLDAFGV